MEEKNNCGIKFMAEEDRPREKLLLRGAGSLSNEELLAIFIGSGTKKKSALDIAQEMLHSRQNSLVELGKLTLSDLKKYDGVGEVKAITLLALMEFGRRRAIAKAAQKRKVETTADAFEMFHARLAYLDHEEVHAIVTDKRGKFLHYYVVSQGGIDRAPCHMSSVFKEALTHDGTRLFVAHNHPGGSLTPSRPDDKMTKSIKDCAEMLEMKLVDHLIIIPAGEENRKYYSYNEANRLN